MWTERETWQRIGKYLGAAYRAFEKQAASEKWTKAKQKRNLVGFFESARRLFNTELDQAIVEEQKEIRKELEALRRAVEGKRQHQEQKRQEIREGILRLAEKRSRANTLGIFFSTWRRKMI